MKTSIFYAQAGLSWLQYFTERCSALTGPLTSQVIRAVGAYDITPQYLDYYAEMPLLGEAGIDLSAQYHGPTFLQGNPLRVPELQAQGDFIHRYIVELQRHLPNAVSECNCFLEMDTASGDAEKAATFINVAGSMVEVLVPRLLAWKGMPERWKIIKHYLTLAGKDMYLWHLGFMESRQVQSLRLVIGFLQDDVELLLQALGKLGVHTPLESLRKTLLPIAKCGLFYWEVDVDILPDGTLGERLGVELLPKKTLPHDQKLVLQTEAYQQFTCFLQEQKLADARIELVPRCILSMLAPDQQQRPYNLDTRISHWKLGWQGKQPLPIKVYVQMHASL